MNRRHLTAPLAILISLVPCSALLAQSGTIVTIAGTGVSGTAGTGGPAANAQLSGPGGIAIDSADNLYIADISNNRIVRVDAVTGILTLVAGNGAAASGGDGGPATQASINHPYGVALDAAGDLFIAEYPGNRIRRVDAQSAIITTFAGTGTAGYSGDGGLASAALLHYPTSVAFDSTGNAFIADSGNACIRRVDAQSGIITTVAGNGAFGITADGASAASASLSPPLGISLDRSNNLLIWEYGSASIRRVDAVTGILTTLAGNGNSGFTGDGVPATTAGIGKNVVNVATDPAGNFFFADGSGRIRRVDGTTGVITTVAGNGSGALGQESAAAGGSGGGGGGGGSLCYATVAGDNGPASIATVDGPFGVVLTRNGNLIFSDWVDCRLRRVYLPSPYPYTNLTLSGSATTAPAGQPVTYTATVSPIGAAGIPTGSITFVDAPLYLGVTVLATVPLSGGSASMQISSLSIGNHQIEAYYNGDSMFNGSGSPGAPLTVTQAQQKATPAVSLTSNQNPVNVNTPVGFMVTVTPPPGSTAQPGGYAQLWDGATAIATASVVNGIAQFSVSFTTTGTHNIGAVYEGDSNYLQSSSASVSETVNAIATTTTLTTSGSPSAYGQSVVLTASVTPSSATGYVKFLDTGVTLASVPLSGGTAVMGISTLSGGGHSIEAVYGGDSADAGSNSALVAQIITKTTPSITLTSNLNPALATLSVTFVATISPGSNGVSVQFLDGQTVLGTVTFGNPAVSFSTSSLSPGTHSITAVCVGDGNLNPVTSAVLTQTITAPTTLSLSSPGAATTWGQPVTFTASVTPAAATGAIQFADGPTPIGAAPIAGGTASLTMPALSVGNHPILASYNGDGVYLSSSSPVWVQTVNKAASSVTVVSSANPSTAGQLVSFSAAISPATATGNVQFLDGSTVVGTAVVANGSAYVMTSSLAAGSHSITAQYSGDANYAGSTSAALAQTVKAASSTTIGTNISPVVYGQQVTLMSWVTPSAATGAVQFLDGTTVLATVTVSGGTANFPIATLTVGTHLITAAYSGDANYGNSTSAVMNLNIGKASPTAALTSSLNPSTAGQAVTFTATVAPTTATGTVQFLDGTTPLGTALVSGGVATVSSSTLGAGSHSITASYSGDGNYNGAISPVVTQTVKATTATTLSANSASITAGQAVQLTASVAPAAATGTVQFLDGASALGSVALSGGSGVLTVSNLGVGSHNLTAVYSGDGNDSASTSAAVVVTVSKAISTLTVTSSLNPSVSGQAVTFTATLTPATATGTVQFLDGATSLGTAAVSGGVAALSVSSLIPGSHSITASYSGDGNDAGSASAVLVETVSKATSTAAVSSSLNPSISGQAVTFTAAIAPPGATGTVQFLNGSTSLGTATVSGGVAVLSTASLSAGGHSITASYSGDGNYNASVSPALTQTVKATTTTALSANSTSITLGQPVQLTASVAPAAATGSVQFLDGGTALGTVTLSSGTAVLTASNLAVGSHSLTAVYSGDGNDTASTSAAVVVTVSKASSATTVSSSLNPAAAGQSVTFTATLTPSTATGTVQFKDGSTVLGTATLANGTATYATSALAVGSHSITAVYSGDGNYNASTASTLTETIKAALPGAPSNLTATAASASQINLSWTASATSGVTYNVYSSTTSGFTPAAGNRIATGVSGTTYSNTGLAASSTHYYVVTAQNSAGESAGTNQAGATTQSGGGGCHVVYTVTTQWNVGFGTAITIQNTGTTAINGWNLTWTWPGNQQITQAWNSNYSQTGANASLTNASWNPAIGAGATISGMGFNGSYSGTDPTPTAFYLNGTLCH